MENQPLDIVLLTIWWLIGITSFIWIVLGRQLRKYTGWEYFQARKYWIITEIILFSAMILWWVFQLIIQRQ